MSSTTFDVRNATMTVYYSSIPTVTLDGGARGQCTGDTCPQDFAGCGYGVANTGGTYDVAITFSESVTGFAAGDITVTNGTVKSLSGGGASYTATITSNCNDCIVEVSVGDNVVNEGNVGAGPLWLPWGANYYQFCDVVCGFIEVPTGYIVVKQETDEPFSQTNLFGPENVRIKKISTNSKVAEFTVSYLPTASACQFLNVAQEDQSTLVHNFTAFRHENGTYAMYVPKIAGHTILRVCSGKTDIGCLASESWSFTANEAGTITTNGSFDATGITVTVADGYWKVSGLTETSAQAEGPAATAPVASAFTPADNATNVSTTTDLVIRFDQTVIKGAGNIVLKKADNSTVQTIDVASANVTLSTTTLTNDTATIAIDDLTASTLYYVTVAAGTFKDSGGTQSFTGISDSTTWNFETEEAGGAGTAPVVSALTPADNAINVSTTTDLVLRFDQPVSKGAGNIIINAGGSPVQTVDVASANVTLSTTTIANDTATVAINDLELNTGYSVTVGAGAFKDAGGTLFFAGITDAATWNFTTTTVPLFRILTLPETTPGASYVVRNTGDNTDVHANGMPSGTYATRLTVNGTVVTDVSVDLTQDREWNEVVAAVDPLQYKAVISFQGADTGVSGTHTLYVPKGPSTTFRVCPEAVTLSAVSNTCPNGVAFTGPFPQTQTAGSDTVTVGTVDIGGSTYWYASGLTGSGGEGEDDEGNTIPFFPVWSIPIIAVIGWYVLRREGWIQV